MRSKENSLIEAMFTWASATALLPPKRLSARWPEPQRRPAGVQAWRAGLGGALRTSLDWARFSTQKHTLRRTSRPSLQSKTPNRTTIFTESDWHLKILRSPLLTILA